MWLNNIPALVDPIFRDKFRLLSIALSIFILFLLGMYSYTVNLAKERQLFTSITQCISGHRTCPDGSVTLLAQVKIINSTNFVVNIRTQKGGRWEDVFERKYDITVIGNIDQLIEGYSIALQGRFISSTTIVLEKYEIAGAWVREIKYGISLLALSLVVLIWLQTFRFSFRRFLFFQNRNP